MLEGIIFMLGVAVPGANMDGPLSVPDQLMARDVSTAIRMAYRHPDATICTRVNKAGSRVKSRKVCMNAESWRVTGQEREQLMRDLTGGISCKGNSG